MAILAERLAASTRASGDAITRVALFLAAGFAGAAAFFRSWGSAYLQKDIVYGSQVKSASLVAAGPYRYVRNPLYFANLLLAVGVGALASPAGFVFLVIGMLTFHYRLILREESELRAARGQSYEAYLRAVPRIFPSARPRVPPSGQRPNWNAGWRAECRCFCFAPALFVFAVTLDRRVLWGILIALFFASWPVAKLKQQ